VIGHGYTYTTLTGRPGDAMQVDTTFYLDEHASIRLIGSGTDRVYLTINHGPVSVAISARPDTRLTDQDVTLVRRLAEESARLLAEIERIHAVQTDQAA
jgi:hypothetical protein